MNSSDNLNQITPSQQGRAERGSSVSPLTYDQAMQRLELLAAKMERDEIGLDDMAECLREAQQLMKYCRECLYEAEKNCKSLLSVEENL